MSRLHTPIPFSLFTLCACGFGLAACSDGSDDARTFDQQVAAGSDLFAEHCAQCHGDAGEGTDDAPALVGAGALPKEPPDDRQFRMNDFNTALDVFSFVDEYMPATDPGSVSEAEKIDILAFALFANGVELDHELTADNADEVVLHE